MHGTILQAFHWYLPGNEFLWDHLKGEAQRLKDVGFTSIWLPPAYKGAHGGYSIGYDIYDLFDLGEFDQKMSIPTKYGTRKSYLEAVRALQQAGLRVMVDIVLNHKAGADETERIRVVKVNPENRTKVISHPMEIEAHTKFTFPGRRGKYSKFIWDHQCFTGIDRILNVDEDAIYKIMNDYCKDDDLWQDVLGEEKGNYDYLMFNDVEFRNPHVREELFYWARWYYDTLHFDAVRIDAVKHMPPAFVDEWLTRLREHTDKDIFAVAEYWAPGYLNLLLKYIDATHETMSLFDSSLQSNFHQASKAGNHYDMRNILKESLTEIKPNLSVTVVSNHDTQPLQALESVVEAWFKPLAYALILLRVNGYPCVFYPDLYGAHYTDKGNDGNEHEIWLPKIDELEMLLYARNNFAYGEQHDYFDHNNCIGFTRLGDDQHNGCAVVMSNGGDGFKEMTMGDHYGNTEFADLLNHCPQKIKTNESGKAIFNCKAGKVSVWVPASRLPDQQKN